MLLGLAYVCFQSPDLALIVSAFINAKGIGYIIFGQSRRKLTIRKVREYDSDSINMENNGHRTNSESTRLESRKETGEIENDMIFLKENDKIVPNIYASNVNDSVNVRSSHAMSHGGTSSIMKQTSHKDVNPHPISKLKSFDHKTSSKSDSLVFRNRNGHKETEVLIEDKHKMHLKPSQDEPENLDESEEVLTEDKSSITSNTSLHNMHQKSSGKSYKSQDSDDLKENKTYNSSSDLNSRSYEHISTVHESIIQTGSEIRDNLKRKAESSIVQDESYLQAKRIMAPIRKESMQTNMQYLQSIQLADISTIAPQRLPSIIFNGNRPVLSRYRKVRVDIIYEP